ncbi:epoxide hydrolase A-like [Rhodamnia argentea]|uniref:soluble epoxide hydrolase n=1 Tax=Rhodamnia argentea TaxID=178133 RepID=A0A8B8MVP6_9MYRT|nr:epoxide hydrolase A-like [Rhodamnia argentea]
METIKHRMVKVNGVNLHVAESGEGPLILFIHGFPELWYMWRHQILGLSMLGFRAVAPDLRGYGDSEAPAPMDAYTALHVVGDLVGLLDAVAAEGEEKAFVVGHDWGALMAWYLCLLRPDRVKALVNLSVPWLPRNPERKPLDGYRATYGDDYYICRFQEPGEIEAEFSEMGTRRVLEGMLTYRIPGPLFFPKGKGFGHPVEDPVVLPSWLTREDVDYYVDKFEKKGFTGGINYYRNINRNWELMAPWDGAEVKVPVKFIVGELDLVYHMPDIKDFIHKGGFKKTVPLLEEVVVMEGVAHFLNQERPHDINQHIHDFFSKF